MPTPSADTPWLALAALPALAVLIATIRRGGPARAALRAAQWLCLAAALAGLGLATQSRVPEEIAAIDLSGSNTPRLEAIDDFLAQTGAPRETVYFGADTRRAPYPPTSSFLDDVDSDDFRNATRLDRLFESLALTAHPHAHALLFTDGLHTGGGDVDAALRRLAQTGVRCFPVLLENPNPAEAAVSAVHHPDSAEAGRPLPLTVELAHTGDTSVLLELVVDGKTVDRRGLDLKPPAETNVIARTHVGLVLPMPEEGPAEAVVRIRPTADTIAQNNQLAFRVIPRGSRRLLTITSPASRDAVAAALSGLPHASVIARTPAEFDPARDLAEVDLVILYDVPHRDLPAGFADELTSAVRDRGAGFLALGGPRSFAAGGYADTEIESLMPVRCQPPGKDLALAMVLDASSSMGGRQGGATRFELARSATLAVVRQLMGRDRLALVTFAATPVVRLELTRRPGDTAAARALAPVIPYGSTDLVAALDRAIDLVRRAESKNRHVLVLSDGRSSTREIDPLIARARDAEITVSVVATGDDPDAELLSRLAQATGGRFYALKNLEDARTTFLDDIRKKRGDLFVTDPRRLAPGAALPAALRDAIASALAQTIVSGVNPVEARDEASVWLVTGDDEPALAFGPAGRGRSGAWPVDVFALANREFLASPQAARLWRDTIDRLAGAAAPPDLVVDTERLGPAHARIAVRRFFNGRPFNNLTPTAIVSSTTGDARALALNPVAPGRYETLWPDAPSERAAVLIVDETRDGEPLWRGSLEAWREEWRHWTIDRDRLARIAEATGGRLVETPADLNAVRALRIEGRSPLRAAALAALAALVLAELAWEAAARRG